MLVVLSHGWVLWPMEFVDSHAWIRPFFRSGNSAVTIFLVASGYLSYSVLARNGMEQMRPLIAIARRVIRVGPVLWTMLVVLMALAAMDATDTASKAANQKSTLHVLTYTYNWLVQTEMFNSRVDFGHLWYLSVDMQAFVLFALVAYMTRRRPLVLLATLVAWYLLLVWWRFHVFGLESIWTVMNRTTVRMDAFILGAIAAAVMTMLPARHRAYRPLALGSLAMLVPLFFWTDTEGAFLTWGGTLLQLTVALHLATSGRVGERQLIAHPVLVRLGRMSLPLYVWHYPIFFFVQRHTAWWWGWQVLVGVTAAVLISLLTVRLVETRVSRVLARPEWARVHETGALRFVATQVRDRFQQRAPRMMGTRNNGAGVSGVDAS